MAAASKYLKRKQRKLKVNYDFWSNRVRRAHATHNSRAHLYRTGEEANPAIKMFSEVGDGAGLETTAQSYPDILDQFVAPKVPRGEGSTQTQVFVDGTQ